MATPAQRMALLAAYIASQPGMKPGDSSAWRVEPAVIRLEFAGHLVILHLGTIA
jgi:hypothetical protein